MQEHNNAVMDFEELHKLLRPYLKLSDTEILTGIEIQAACTSLVSYNISTFCTRSNSIDFRRGYATTRKE